MSADDLVRAWKIRHRRRAWTVIGVSFMATSCPAFSLPWIEPHAAPPASTTPGMTVCSFSPQPLNPVTLTLTALGLLGGMVMVIQGLTIRPPAG